MPKFSFSVYFDSSNAVKDLCITGTFSKEIKEKLLALISLIDTKPTEFQVKINGCFVEKKISGIKRIRELTNYDLLTAKRLWEAAETNFVTINFLFPEAKKHEIIESLKEYFTNVVVV